jgi:hypothetical protein
MVTPPILDNKLTSSPSVFNPSALLREAWRQKNLEAVNVPGVNGGRLYAVSFNCLILAGSILCALKYVANRLGVPLTAPRL